MSISLGGAARDITIRVGDVHSELGLVSRHPLVCSALGSKKFEAGVKQMKRTGPHQGANTTFHYEAFPSSPIGAPVDRGETLAPANPRTNRSPGRMVSIDELGTLRRRIVDLLNDVEGAPPALEGPGQRLSRLKRQGKIPRTMAQLMFTIIEARNEGEWQRTSSPTFRAMPSSRRGQPFRNGPAHDEISQRDTSEASCLHESLALPDERPPVADRKISCSGERQRRDPMATKQADVLQRSSGAR